MSPRASTRTRSPLTTLRVGVAVAALAAAAVASPACLPGSSCNNGACSCGQGASCRFTCDAPPCHTTCNGDNPECTAACANGTCVCGSGSHCDFTCDAPPCNVTCEPDSACAGVCANGQCTCFAASTCAFTCATPPCHTNCATGSSCVVHCPAGLAGGSSCDITPCASGGPTTCPDGVTVTCNAPCP